jgi:pimeloyl-ACP methyl ester carboxylesterase
MLIELDATPVFIYTGGKPLRPELPGVLFLHGAANDHSVWALQSRWFAHHGYNALAVDLPDHGRSGGSALASIEQLADWTTRLIDAIGLDTVHLVGHSMGSLVALETAARAPRRLEKLALLGCAVPMSVSDTLLDAARDDEAQAIALITGWSHAPGTLLWGGPIPGMWLPGVGRALMGRAAPGQLHRDLANCRQYTGGLAAARKVACPTLLLTGDRDVMTPRKASQELKASLPDIRERPIGGAGHAMMSEQPDAVLDALRDFLQ